MKNDGTLEIPLTKRRNVNRNRILSASKTNGSGERKQGWQLSDALFILQCCLVGRFYVFIAQLFARILFPTFNTDAFLGVKENETNLVDSTVEKLLSGFARWDGVHFLHIAKYGYIYENSLAFFPFFPLLVHFVGLLCHWVMPIMSLSNTLLVSAVLINLVAFMLSSQLLYVILIRLSNRQIALTGCIIFSLNPSSIFFSASYTESVFFCLTLSGLTLLYTDEAPSCLQYFFTTCFFSLSFLTRSNGFLNLGYILYKLMLDIFSNSSFTKPKLRRNLTKYLLKMLRGTCICAFSFVIITSLVAVHGIIQKNRFCTTPSSNFPKAILKTAEENHLILAGDVANMDWCKTGKHLLNPLPVFYGPVQKKYWDVGFLQYWQIKKIPCFILSLPALVIVFLGSKQFTDKYFSSDKSPLTAIKAILCDRYTIFPFMVHATFISICGVLFYNAEVVTRMLFSSSPFMYFVMAKLIEAKVPSQLFKERRMSILPFFFESYGSGTTVLRIISSYLIIYALVGSAMHAVWLPFV